MESLKSEIAFTLLVLYLFWMNVSREATWMLETFWRGIFGRIINIIRTAETNATRNAV